MSLVDYASSSDDDDDDVLEDPTKEEKAAAAAAAAAEEEREPKRPQQQTQNDTQAPSLPSIPLNPLILHVYDNKKDQYPHCLSDVTDVSRHTEVLGLQPWAGTLLSNQAAPDLQALPGASALLNAPSFSSISGTDHASRVAAAIADASRKRGSNGVATSSIPQSKLARGDLRQLKSVPDTLDGVLLPPQLRGRGNVVTEDIGKLFVKRNADSPPN